MHIRYEPPGPVSRAFMRSDAFVRGIMGPFGSGKSTACVMEIVRRAQTQPKGSGGLRRSRWAVVRNTYVELRTTTIKTWHQWVPRNFGSWVDSGPPRHTLRTDDGLELEVLFLALDTPSDVAKLLSMELTGAWINEAREVPKAVLDGLTGRVGRYPSTMLGGQGWSGIIMDTNPPDTDHWWYKLAEETRPEGFEFFRQPGGLDALAENVSNLPDGYYTRQMAGKEQDWINVYVNADYGFVQDGKPVYPEFRDGLHVRECDPVAGLPLHVGIDFGLTPAATIGQRTARGQWRILSEVVTEDMGAKRFSEVLKAHLRTTYGEWPVETITGDPAGDIRAQTDEITPFLILRSAGVNARPAETNDFVRRREAVAMPLSRLLDGEPGLIVDPRRCPMLRKAMAGAYCYRRIQVSGQERYRDVPDKGPYSHVAESLQYLMLGAGEGKELVRRTQHHGHRPQVADGEYSYFG